ncbi:hypothetical protein C3747_120g88 [Trypanosoma cruzi]|uniref:Uncharacterized protein n=2 Tax=Trypanosoma cruzi TaxID=5693 RepID=Q4D962_TRYCC|nr:hypothetical protein, conserved [Trypanosoma cruzi]EAN89065.1 hypothetical protein, conserved [Trypanosoma cruzi]PWV06090.1 hypothetical protein C3747_120g88 [Trypanosoma cruzi]RNC48259.1 hypothetical protein TcCL_NonESM01856 [Trypanosoma cruzi]|eukprot:XP_810916.1 hypothetical protein [Trypanosoma cruzi strain CL Brener]
MEELLEREIEDLKQQQQKLEQELMAIDELSCCMQQSGQGDVNNSLSIPAVLETGGGKDAIGDGVSLRERMAQLDELRLRYQRESSRALRRYFDVVSGFPQYQAKRERLLCNPRPFSFESRELQKEQRIRTRRMESEQRQKEQALQQILNYRFKANPVPPSTYMNKYDLMVEEWRQRRAAVEALAIEKAERMKAETELVRISAESMRQVREIMGVRHDAKAKRAQSADFEGRDRRRVEELREIPLEVKMKLWPALEEHEQVRVERIKQRAAERFNMLKEEEARRLAPVGATSHVKEQQQHFPAGPMPLPAVPVGGPIEAVAASPTAPQMILVGNAPAATPGPTTTQPLAQASLPATGEVAGEKRATSATQPPLKRRSQSGDKRAYNRNMTFKPRIHGGVPDFKSMWADERLTLAERKRKTQPTEVKSFNLTVSPKETVIRGRPALPTKRFVSATHSRQRSRSAASGVKPTQPTSQPVEKDKKLVPKGTRAHAIRTRAVFIKYLRAAETDASRESNRDDLKAIREGHERQKVVNARLKEYLRGTSTNTDAIIKKKVRALRQRSREMEKEAFERLVEMRMRVAQIPPIFVEPTHLHDIAKTRAETEKEIIHMLEETGMNVGTLATILTAGGNEASSTSNVNAVEAATSTPDTGAVTAVETKTEEKSKLDVTSTREERVRSVGDSSVSDSPSDGSTDFSRSGSSSSSRTGAPKEKSDYDDDFEASTNSSTISL